MQAEACTPLQHMRRYAPLLLFAVVLITPFALRWLYANPRDTAPDALQLVIVSPHVEGIRREFADAFSNWHAQRFGQPVFLDYRVIGGTSEIVKFFEASKQTVFDKQGTYKVDLVWGGGDYLFDQQLKQPGFLERVTLDRATITRAFPKPDLNGIALYDTKDGTWFGTALSSFGICLNKDVCR
jgi:hypothetical protein